MKYVVLGNLDISNNERLVSLEGCPKEVGGDFVCVVNYMLETLEGGPEKVGGSFVCSANESLKSLKGCPREVGGSFECTACGFLYTENPLDHGWGERVKVGGDFWCSAKFSKDEVRKYFDVAGKIFN